MKPISAIRLVALLCASVAVGACVGTAPSKELRLIDSLNQQAYAFRYKNIDSSCHAAMQAYKSVNLYRAGEAEACNNLGFCAFMRMDFEEAERYFRKVYSLTKNELELLIADIGFMKIYQRTALNKEFYDYRNSALRRMRRIGEDNNLFVDRHERARLEYARSEFYIVSAVYYYYLQQRSEALDNIGQLKEAELASDTSQLLYYYYIKGAASLCEADTLDSQRLLEFDALYKTWRIASRKGYVYFEGNGIQGLVNLMASPTDYELFKLRRGHALKQFGYPVDSLLPLRLGQLALQKFRQSKTVDAIFCGLRPASTALIASAGLSVAASVLMFHQSGHEIAPGQAVPVIQLFHWPVVVLAAAIFVAAKWGPLKKLHPVAFIAFAAVLGVVFQF